MMKRKRTECIRNYSSKKNRSLVDQNDWDRCQDGFDIRSQGQTSPPMRKSFGSSNKKSKAKLLSNEQLASEDDNVNISWSSSDDSCDTDLHPLVFESPDASPEFKKKRIRRSIINTDEPSKPVLVNQQIAVTSQNSEASEVLISDYESASDDGEDDEIRDNSSSQQTSETYSISSMSSSLPSSSLSSGTDVKNASPKKGSNLVNLLKQQIKSPQATEENEPLDSSKKKSKFLRGGLADRLQKLISRERSSVAMWNHRAVDLKNNASSTSLTVSLQKVHVNRGIYISECLDITSVDESEQSVIHVLFSTPTARQLNIAEGSIVTIYPPWQRLNLPQHSAPILLCTHYCQLVGQASETTKQSHTSTYQTTRRKMLFDEMPSAESLTVRPVLEEVTIQPVKAFDEDDSASDSILDSIADSSGHSTKGMCIRATMQRVCCYNARHAEQHDNIVTTNQRWFLILQDIRGVFCEMQLPDGCHGNATWRQYLDGEGKTFIFKGAKVSQRTNRSRSVRLFSMLDSMWPPSDEILPAGFNSQSQDSQGPHSLPAPCFCYTLTIDSLHDTLRNSKKQHAIYKTSRECQLKDINNMPSRFSVQAKVWYITPTSTDSHTVKRVYITDPSLHSLECNAGDLSYFAYRCMLLESSCVVESELIGCVLLFKDIFVDNDGCLHADTYSRIIQVDQRQVCVEFQHLGVHFQPMSEDCNQFELVSVQGEIIGADESSAYHWPVCEECGSDKLHVVASLNDQLYCEVCKKEIVSTCMRMFLEVYIECTSVKNVEVKLQLLQSSIERILPPITAEIKLQGFDLQSIMGKQIGPITAIVRTMSKSSNQYVLEEIKI